MRCPACSSGLSSLDANSIIVEICSDGCGGAWFDREELSKFDEEHEAAPFTLLRPMSNQKVVVDHSKTRHCPKCASSVLSKKLFDEEYMIDFDYCAGCEGVWLDLGELMTMRENNKLDDDIEGVLSASAAKFNDSSVSETTRSKHEAVFTLLFK